MALRPDNADDRPAPDSGPTGNPRIDSDEETMIDSRGPNPLVHVPRRRDVLSALREEGGPHSYRDVVRTATGDLRFFDEIHTHHREGVLERTAKEIVDDKKRDVTELINKGWHVRSRAVTEAGRRPQTPDEVYAYEMQIRAIDDDARRTNTHEITVITEKRERIEDIHDQVAGLLAQGMAIDDAFAELKRLTHDHYGLLYYEQRLSIAAIRGPNSADSITFLLNSGVRDPKVATEQGTRLYQFPDDERWLDRERLTRLAERLAKVASEQTAYIFLHKGDDTFVRNTLHFVDCLTTHMQPNRLVLVLGPPAEHHPLVHKWLGNGHGGVRHITGRNYLKYREREHLPRTGTD